MARIVLISCVGKKLPYKAKAQDLYISSLFRKALQYAKSLDPDNIFILSAKYGLLKLDKMVEPYDKTLNKMRSNGIKEWANSILNQLKKATDLNNDEFIFLAGNNYRKFLLPHIKHYNIPMQVLSIGRQLQWLTKRNETNKNCNRIHQLFNEMKRFSFPFTKQDIPKNGIYILFEKGEFAHSVDRIVRIGTHTGENQLCSRLFQHFLQENKDRSIFRKNIGRALLNKDKDPFLKKWEIDLTTKKTKKLYSDSIDFKKQKEVEKRVTKYIQNNFSFIVFQITEKEKRFEFESKIISTVSLCKECKPSENWLGNFSPKEKIQKSGLWLVNELWKIPFI